MELFITFLKLFGILIVCITGLVYSGYAVWTVFQLLIKKIKKCKNDFSRLIYASAMACFGVLIFALFFFTAISYSSDVAFK